jgi:hypothetical protein
MFLLQCNQFSNVLHYVHSIDASLNLLLMTILFNTLKKFADMLPPLQFSEGFSRSPLLLCLFWYESSFSCSVQASYRIMLSEPSEVTNISCPGYVVLSIYSG